MTPPASFSSASFTNDGLVAGTLPVLSKKVTLLSGQNCVRGTVLGLVQGAIAAPVAGAANVGNGVFAATPTAAAGIRAGTYRLTIVEPASNLGNFVLEDPGGITVGVGKVGTAYAGGHLAFTLNDGATDFSSGDTFTIVVAEGTKYAKSASAAADGSETPRAILAQDADATSADVEAEVYVRGDFSENALTFGTGHTADTVREALRLRNIHLVKPQGA